MRSLSSIAESPTTHLPPKLKRQLAAAADERRRSGKTVEARMADLSTLVVAMAKHFPLHGIHLLEFCEELADGVQLQLQPPGS
jgi:carbonic anhydrase